MLKNTALIILLSVKTYANAAALRVTLVTVQLMPLAAVVAVPIAESVVASVGEPSSPTIATLLAGTPNTTTVPKPDIALTAFSQ